MPYAEPQGVAAHLTWSAWLIVILGSGVVSAILTKVGDGVLGRWQRNSEQKHARTMQAEQLQHQRDQDREAREQEILRLGIAAHDKARDELIDDAGNVAVWINYQWGVEHGLDSDFSNQHDPKPKLSDVTSVIEALWKLSTRHPTRPVRKVAEALRQGISGHYGSIVPEYDHKTQDWYYTTASQPSDESFRKWSGFADELIERMNTPPLLEDVRQGSPSE